MSDAITRLEHELAALRQSMAVPGLPEPVVAMLRQQIADKEAELARQSGPAQGLRVERPQAGRDNYIATSQVINNFFGGEPGEDGERLLAAYLDAMAEDCQRLRLHRLTGKRQSGSEQRSQTDDLRLQDVYTTLTTDGPPIVVYQRRRTNDWIDRLLKRARIAERSPEHVRPELVRVPRIGNVPLFADADASPDELLRTARYAERVIGAVGREDPGAPLILQLVRPELALEAIFFERRLVLLGEPGAGKSTVLRYLALLLAARLRGREVRVPGWPVGETPVPVIVPLGRVAAALSAGELDAYTALLRVIGDQLEAEVRLGLRRFLTPALRDGGVLLLCDGLDELPASPTDAQRAPRVAVAAALRRLAAETKARIVVTSRVLPYKAVGDWKLLPEDGWALRTVQSLAFGQTQAFVQGWYRALGQSDPDIRVSLEQRSEALIEELRATERLRPLVRSPLLLTMLAVLHANTGDVPRDRAKLYDECVELLLDRWEPERQPGLLRDSLVQRLGLPSLDPLRRVLHELAYQAQLQPPGDDGRGLIGIEPLTQRMFTFFKQLGTLAEADTRTTLFLSILDAEDGGLLQRRGDEGYAFPHLTFQEYMAACHLANQTRMAEPAYQRWCGDDRERWRQALLLLMGRLSQQDKAEEKGLPWLKLLASRNVSGRPKEPTQRRRDAVLAALSYAELRERGAFAGSLLDVENEIEAPLRSAIVALLEQADAQVAMADRIAAARVLGRLGDPRVPIELEDWRRELTRRDDRLTPEGEHYWRYVPGGTYKIGGWNELQTPDEAPDQGEEQDEREEPVELELAAFWVARLPITVAQFAPFLAEGYGEKAKRLWTPQGWGYHQEDQQPQMWGALGYHMPNQPVTIITWYEATAFCAWLTEQLGEELPEGYIVRLPTEAEWEAAASIDGQGGRRPYPWGDEDVLPERAITNAFGFGVAAPIGCCPAGVSACGALDMAGNVWEWTCSSYETYPKGASKRRKDFTSFECDVPLRGGSYREKSTNVRCGARIRSYPSDGRLSYGFRVIVAPALARMS